MDDAANIWIQLITVIIGGFLTISSAIILFWLQQSAARREARRERQLDAIKHVSEALRTIEEAAKGTPEEISGRFSEMMWPFLWSLNRRDMPIAGWVTDSIGAMLDDVAKTTDVEKREQILNDQTALMIGTLIGWRSGSINRRWFVKERVRLQESKSDSS